jgi:hypothetical protein
MLKWETDSSHGTSFPHKTILEQNTMSFEDCERSMEQLKSIVSDPFMHGWRRILVLIFLESQNFWNFVLFLHCRGFIMYAPSADLHPFGLFNESDLLTKKNSAPQGEVKLYITLN